MDKLRLTALLMVLLSVGLGAAVAPPGLAAEQENARKVTKRVKPVYPPIARQMRLSGTVRLMATVTPSGKVKSVEILGGNAILAAAAEEAAKQWTFEAAPKETRETLTFEFVP